VEYDKKDFKGKIIDVNDEKVKDRWSRYIGAMGIDAVNRQSKADILVFGLGPVGL
jgi:tRNA A37 threonylcarbamoyladenosine dehydratase